MLNQITPWGQGFAYGLSAGIIIGALLFLSTVLLVLDLLAVKWRVVIVARRKS